MLHPLIQRLHDACVDRGDDIDGGIEIFFRHSCFPCVRKASFRSRLAVARHRHSQPEQHLFPLAQASDGMRVTIKSAKVGFVHKRLLNWVDEFRVSGVRFQASISP